MTHLQYQVLHYIYQQSGKQDWDIQSFAEEQYHFLNERSINMVGREIDVSKEEFSVIIEQIYQVLKLRLTESDIDVFLSGYLGQLSSDCVFDHNLIDLKFCLDNLHYLVGWTSEKETSRYYQDISYIQDSLYKKFDIQEKFTDKVKRKMKLRSLC